MQIIEPTQSDHTLLCKCQGKTQPTLTPTQIVKPKLTHAAEKTASNSKQMQN